jgi:dynein heavy chain
MEKQLIPELNLSPSFSENYIFGKFDTFCKRLDKIIMMINTMDSYSGLPDVKIEGIDTIVVRYKTVCDGAKKKNYDILDHRKSEVFMIPGF